MNGPVLVHAPQTPDAAVVVVEGVVGDPSTAPDPFVTVHVERDGRPGDQAVQGRYRRAGSRIEFTTLHPFIGGQRYHVHIGGRPAATFTLSVTTTGPTPDVLAIHPTGPVIPANTLRLYVTFSAPMQRQQAHRHIELTDDHSRDAAALIVDLGHELWSPDSTRLTLLLDPGTSKRGIHTRPEPGPALRPGDRYTLTVRPGWPSATGIPLTSGLRRSYRIGPALRTPLDSAAWRLSTPAPASTDPLQVTFDRTMDAALLANRLTVHDSDGRPVPGHATTTGHETTWAFIPHHPWGHGAYRLAVAPDLEDVSGNRVGEALDREPGIPTGTGPPIPTQAGIALQTPDPARLVPRRTRERHTT